MSKIQTVEIKCDGCGQPGRVAKSTADAGGKVTHSPAAGGCGLQTSMKRR